MTEFTLDTSGAVHLTWGVRVGNTAYAGNIRFRDLDAFTQGYVEAALRDLYARLVRMGTGLLPPAFRDLAPETLAAILQDCEWFLSAQFEARPDFESSADAGRNFYLLRQKGGFQNPPLPPQTATLGDDGKVYLTAEG